MKIGIIGDGNIEGIPSEIPNEIQKAIDLVISNCKPEELEECNIDIIIVKPNKSKEKVGIGYNKVEQYLKVIEQYIDNNKPEILIVATKENKDLIIPKLCYKYKMDGYLDCVGISIDFEHKDSMLTKPVYGGNINCSIKVELPVIIGFRSNLKTIKSNIDYSKKISVKYIELENSIEKKVIISNYIEIVEQESITKADIVIVCGYGVGCKENVQQIEKYAKSIGAVVGGTKKVIDFNWLPLHKLIGQTGKVVSPKVCLCIGVSGATPFINGILSSEKIIAINKDSGARIFNYADIGIIEDYKLVLDL